MLQLFYMTEQELAQMQFMLDVSRSMAKGFIINPCRRLNTWCNNPSFSLHPKVVLEEDVEVAEATAAEAAQMVTSSSNLLNDTQYQVLPSQTLD